MRKHRSCKVNGRVAAFRDRMNGFADTQSFLCVDNKRAFRQILYRFEAEQIKVGLFVQF